MLNRFRQVVNNVIANMPQNRSLKDVEDMQDTSGRGLQEKYSYTRPEFLQLSSEEVSIASDSVIRPIMVPRDLSKLPWHCGYAEAANGGKSKFNEDQAAASHFVLKGHNQEKVAVGAEDRSTTGDPDDIPMTYFAIFDGHAGTGAALMSANTLHYQILEKLDRVYELLVNSTPEHRQFSRRGDLRPHKWPFSETEVSVESLVTGALEAAFVDMDDQIRQEKLYFSVSGGCTVLVALFLLGKLYIANAGDSRAIICKGSEVIPMSTDFNPVTERQRVQYLASVKPELLGDEFSALEFQKRVHRKDIGKKVMYRDCTMTGWTYKLVTEEDLNFPLVVGEGKKARLLATIGVTRGFGDHDLKVQGTDIAIKPFLTPVPEVKVYNLFDQEHTENDVLVLATDGLWDILSNEKVVEIVMEVMLSFPPGDYKRYASAAQELIMAARGILKSNGWRTKDGKPGSGDDISVFIVPLCHHIGLSPQNSWTESHDTSGLGSSDSPQ
ncbi:protein phosphatase 1H-like [Acanthaster planci]|uniref:Protein phosphatase 1H-like n=1 Tax=Acanthaster planci TaxID=133434 RepID=A0A8B7ZL24_ACAPL|nr:protein phosphatase 1H-like [Acanthaster planci]XP_022104015.1 protein phosphatase 1H-like [Acanthaster planci]XP_022104016.1 protein phosphatase 1H-like [Acanthaster planci]XP_022104017.1 protein phosphatase 1H-like [Acanthaster planci]XP_022104018.1 protein phosphatase 1H-like [Acanthaster planci]XP_022104019.1 protein phosphatase 1H-like [Acanthaster planci]XP_022104020.1 protein phosphatase 1H-like [Acanthaster planci]